MPGVGVGGLISNLLNPGMDQQLARAITPNPNPLAQTPPGAPTVDQLGNPTPPPTSNLAPAAVTQPDPVNASYAELLLKAHRNDQLSNDLNKNLAGVAAGFGTAQQQASKTAALQGMGGPDDTLGALAKIQGMQDVTREDNEHARFMASAHTFAQTLSQSLNRPVSDQEAATIMNSPDLMKAFGTATGANATTTGTQKDAEAATRAWADAHPKATPQEIADYKANLIAGGMGGSDLEQRQYLAEKSSGVTTDDFATWKSKKAAEATTLTTQAKAAQEFKDTATGDYTANNSKLTSIQSYIETLKKDPAAAQEALKMLTPNTGQKGAWNPLNSDPKVAAAAVALQKIKAQLTAEGLSGVKNVRNAREFNTLGQAATGGLDASATPEDFAKAIDDLSNKFLDAQATNELAVGHKLTGKLIGHGSSDLLEPTVNGKPNPYYNGGSEDAQPLKGDDLAKVQQALAEHPEKRQIILDGVIKNGFSPRGL